MTKIERTYIKAVHASPLAFESILRRGKHPKMVCRTPSGKRVKISFSASPSDYRAFKNFAHTLRRSQ